MMYWCFFFFFLCVKFLVWSFGWKLGQQYMQRAASIQVIFVVVRYRVFEEERPETCVALWGWHAKILFFFSTYNLHKKICCLYLRKQLYWMCTSLSLSSLKLYQITGTYPHTEMSLFIIFWCLHFCSNSVALASSWNLLHSSEPVRVPKLRLNCYRMHL